MPCFMVFLAVIESHRHAEMHFLSTDIMLSITDATEASFKNNVWSQIFQSSLFSYSLFRWVIKELVMYMSTAEIRRLLEARKWALFRQIFRSLLASQVLRISRAPVHFKTIRCLAVMLLRCKRTVENLPGRKQTPLVDHKLSLQHYFFNRSNLMCIRSANVCQQPRRKACDLNDRKPFVMYIFTTTQKKGQKSLKEGNGL